MPDDYKALAKQIERLGTRLSKLEGSISRSSSGGAKESEEALAFCAVPPMPERELDPNISAERARLIRDIEKKWVNGTELRYYFFESGSWAGAEPQKAIVRDGFKVWSDAGIGIVFEETGNIADSEIRVGFLRGDGYWSYIGRDVLSIGQNERTMNFGSDLTLDRRGVDVPVHEIGHTLGFPHEHQNPFAGIVWDEEAVYALLAQPPNNWTRETTFHNILRKLSASTVEGSEWDPDSVMHYDFPGGLIRQPEQYSQAGIHPPGGLSDADVEEVKRFYPPLRDTRYTKLEPFRLEHLDLAPAEQANFSIEPDERREYTMQTFGRSDTVMVLFEEDRNGDLRFVAGDDDSGTSRNASISEWLDVGKRYVLRVRLYLNYASGKSALLLW
jgi:hypothetical protein